MNHVSEDFISKFVIAYNDGILVYSSDVDSHQRHLREVLLVLKAEQLYANFQ